MPYASLLDLPPAIRHLPVHGQEIIQAAFNHAWQEYPERNPEQQEEIANRVARAAVKRRYDKRGNI